MSGSRRAPGELERSPDEGGPPSRPGHVRLRHDDGSASTNPDLRRTRLDRATVDMGVLRCRPSPGRLAVRRALALTNHLACGRGSPYRCTADSARTRRARLLRTV